MLDITLFIFKTSIFDVKIDALNLLLLMNKVREKMEEFYTNRSRTNSWAFKNETTVIDQEKEIFIQNYILPFYLLGEGILVSSSSISSNSTNNDNLNNTEILDNDRNLDKNNDNKNKKKGMDSEKDLIKIAKNYKKLNKRSLFNKKNVDLDNDDFNKTMTFNNRNNFKINKNGKQFVYIKITPDPNYIAFINGKACMSQEKEVEINESTTLEDLKVDFRENKEINESINISAIQQYIQIIQGKNRF